MEDKTPSIPTVALAGLLHDIGKVGQRAFKSDQGLSQASARLADYICPTGSSGYPTHRHVLYTSEFCERIQKHLPREIDGPTMSELAAYHHNPADDRQTLMTEADQLSAAIERSGPTHSSAATFRTVRLAPVMAAVTTGAKAANRTDRRLPLTAYQADRIFAIEADESMAEQDTYEQIWNSVLNSFADIGLDDELKFVNSALSVLERHLWSVPSATNVAWPDISLFDHSRATAAIAVALHLSDDAERPFLLVGGDFGSIQKFISRFSDHQKGLARALRGRSFQVAAFSDHVALAILGRLKLPMTQLVMYAGGHFTLLLPNNTEAAQVVDDVRRKIHRWVLENYFGELSFALAPLAISRDQLKDDFADVSSRLHQMLQREKQSGLTPLRKDGKWAPEAWLRDTVITSEETLCPACRVRPADPAKRDGDDALCGKCFSEREIGRQLPKSSFMQYHLESRPDSQLPLAQFELVPNESGADRHADIVLDFRGSETQSTGKPFFTVLRNHYVPREEDGKVMEFESIALHAEGTPYLGYLKADIDNLGFIFARGLQAADGHRGRASISRIATLSRTLEYFFSGYLRHLLETEFRTVYTVFSGGDDMLFVGPWDTMFHLARRLREEFDRYACGNPCWGLSCGIAIEKPHTPIYYSLQAADSLLEQSKAYQGKNAITALGLTLPWAEYARALEQADKVAGWVRGGTIKSSQLRRLLQYGEVLQEFQQTGNTNHLWVVPQLIYDLTRNWGQRSPEERDAKQWAHQFTNPEHPDIGLLKFISQYAIYKCR